jgi:hypothetical protein
MREVIKAPIAAKVEGAAENGREHGLGLSRPQHFLRFSV